MLKIRASLARPRRAQKNRVLGKRRLDISKDKLDVLDQTRKRRRVAEPRRKLAELRRARGAHVVVDRRADDARQVPHRPHRLRRVHEGALHVHDFAPAPRAAHLVARALLFSAQAAVGHHHLFVLQAFTQGSVCMHVLVPYLALA